jgi:hypothetical protein
VFLIGLMLDLRKSRFHRTHPTPHLVVIDEPILGVDAEGA